MHLLVPSQLQPKKPHVTKPTVATSRYDFSVLDDCVHCFNVVFFQDCFLAFNFVEQYRQNNPGYSGYQQDPTNVVGKILSHVRAAATATAAPMSVMLIPAGLDLKGYQREQGATFQVTGIKQNEIAPVQFPLQSIVTDPTTNLKIGVHYPLLSYDGGSRNPMAQENTGLTQTVYVIGRRDPYIPAQGLQTEGSALEEGFEPFNDANLGDAVFGANGLGVRVDGATAGVNAAAAAGPNNITPDNGRINELHALLHRVNDDQNLPSSGAEQGSPKLWVYKLTCSSAIVAAPGPDTGEMLVAYPQTTAHSVEVAPEEMKMQMRAYLGAAIYNDANVIRVPHVHCEHAEQISTRTFFGEMTLGNPTEGNLFANRSARVNGMYKQVKEGILNGTILFLNTTQLNRVLTKMDLNIPAQAAGGPPAQASGFNAPVSTRGQFTSGDSSATGGGSASTDGGSAAAVVSSTPDGGSASIGGGFAPDDDDDGEFPMPSAAGKKKKKGARA